MSVVNINAMFAIMSRQFGCLPFSLSDMETAGFYSMSDITPTVKDVFGMCSDCDCIGCSCHHEKCSCDDCLEYQSCLVDEDVNDELDTELLDAMEKLELASAAASSALKKQKLSWADETEKDDDMLRAIEASEAYARNFMKKQPIKQLPMFQPRITLSVKPQTVKQPMGWFTSKPVQPIVTQPIPWTKPQEVKQTVKPACTVCGENTHETSMCFKYKTVLCKFDSKCTNSKCTFAHGKELRTPFKLICSKMVDGVMIGCGGCHKFELCKKKYCTWCESDDHWTGTTDECVPYCKFCKEEGHDFEDCPKKKCKKCGEFGHWYQSCTSEYIIH